MPETMPRDPKLTARSYGPRAGGRPRQLVILLHGITNDAEQMHRHAQALGREMPHAEFLSVNAPWRYDGALKQPAGTGRQWFSLRRHRPDQLWFGAMRMTGILNRYINRELERRGLDDRHLALMGFSQGAVMAKYTALRRPQPCGAVVGIAGRYAGWSPTRATPPVLLIHGTADPTVPYRHMESSARALSRAGCFVATVTRKGQAHDFTGADLELSARFMNTMLAARARQKLKQPAGRWWDPVDLAARLHGYVFGGGASADPKTDPRPDSGPEKSAARGPRAGGEAGGPAGPRP